MTTSLRVTTRRPSSSRSQSINKGTGIAALAWSFSIFYIIFSWTIDSGSSWVSFASAQTEVDCDPCIDRESYKLKAFFPGTSPFWEQIQAAAIQSSNDLGIDFESKLYDDPTEMADDIRNNVGDASALIVSVPNGTDPGVVAALEQTDKPIFGCNLGYDKNLGSLAWVGQDEFIVGKVAAETWLEEVLPDDGTSLTATVGYVDSHGIPTFSSEFRFEGITSAMEPYGIVPMMMTPDMIGSCDDMTALFVSAPGIDAILEACGGSMASTVIALDESAAVWNGMEDGIVSWYTGQQPYLQGTLAVFLAATYVTTSFVPALPVDNPNRLFLTGPVIIDDVPSEDEQACILDSFPVCPSTGSNGCECTDRGDIKIGGVLHGVKTNTFWDPIYAAADQSARDMAIKLDNTRFEEQSSNNIVHIQMNDKITTLCEGETDAVFVSIPSEVVIPGIEVCKESDKPVIAINAGPEAVSQFSLMHYIGQLDYNAGFAAAQQLMDAGMVRGWCLNHEPETQSVTIRCVGMANAMAEVDGVVYEGQVVVPLDSNPLYAVTVEQAVGDTGDWAGNGFLLTTQSQLPAAIELFADHPAAVRGTFDTGVSLFEALDQDEILFGVDQVPYIQGYFPVPLLTYFVQSGQRLLNEVVQSGPSFVRESPSDAQIFCENNFYEVCGAEPATDAPTTSPTTELEDAPPNEGSGAVGIRQMTSTLGFIIILATNFVWR